MSKKSWPPTPSSYWTLKDFANQFLIKQTTAAFDKQLSSISGSMPSISPTLRESPMLGKSSMLREPAAPARSSPNGKHTYFCGTGSIPWVSSDCKVPLLTLCWLHQTWVLLPPFPVPSPMAWRSRLLFFAWVTFVGSLTTLSCVSSLEKMRPARWLSGPCCQAWPLQLVLWPLYTCRSIN